VKNVRVHHNLLDNVSDDGIFLTAGTAADDTTPGGDIAIGQNLFSRCLTTFAFGVGRGRQKALANGLQTGSGVYIYRNVFDYRRPVHYHQPRSASEPQQVTSKGRFATYHGGPAWEPMNIYHNTIIADDVPRYTYGTAGLGDHMGHGTRRRVFNNIIVQLQALPGATLPPVSSDFQADGNLHWSKKRYPSGWGAADRFADPKFVKLAADWRTPMDLRLRPDSPTVDAGVGVPETWPDPVKMDDRGRPDIGALPQGARVWRVGVRGRLTMFGEETSSE
jgi:hypothetical protein